MAKQMHLPGISDRATVGDRKALVQSRLIGFELRQKERARRRAERARPSAPPPAPPAQVALFPAAAEPGEA